MFNTRSADRHSSRFFVFVHHAEYERAWIFLVSVITIPRLGREAAEYVRVERLDNRERFGLVVALGMKVGSGETVSARAIQQPKSSLAVESAQLPQTPLVLT